MPAFEKSAVSVDIQRKHFGQDQERVRTDRSGVGHFGQCARLRLKSLVNTLGIRNLVPGMLFIELNGFQRDQVGFGQLG